MSRAPSKQYLKAHQALLDLWECVDFMERRQELESLLDEVNACDKRMRWKDPSLAAYQAKELTNGLMPMDEIRGRQQRSETNAAVDRQFAEGIYGPFRVTSNLLLY